MKIISKFFAHLFVCIWSYWYSYRCQIKKRLGLTYTFHTCFIYDKNYNYYSFYILPRLSFEFRLYTPLKYKGPVFDYLKIKACFFVFHFTFLFERKG